MLRDAKERAILLSDFSRSYLVEAGAGSGKTALMAGRLALLFASGVSPERVVALSFTDLAAQELANRVRRYVIAISQGTVPKELELGLPDGISDPQRVAAAKALTVLDRFTCSTLHSFARQLITRYPAEANIDPGASLLTEQESNMLFTETFREWLHRELNRTDTDNSFIAAAVAHGGQHALRTLESLTKSLLTGEHHAFQEPDLERFEQLEHELRPRIRAVERVLRTATTAPNEAIERARQLRVFLTLLGSGNVPAETAFFIAWIKHYGNRLDTLFTNSGDLRRRPPVTKKAWTGGTSIGAPGAEYERFKGAWDALLECYEELTLLSADYLLAEFSVVGHELVQAYHQAKRRRALLDFDDLIPAALQLVQNHTDVANQLQDTYEYFFIDEFQDTDPRSAELFWRVSGQPTADSWETWPARGASRFVVGDPKQSIYRFRGADVFTYLRLKQQFARDESAREVNISSNFRSDEAIIHATNTVFAEPLSAETQPGYAALHPVQPRGAKPAIWRLPVPLDDNPTSYQIASAEANAVADLVARFIAGDPELTDVPVRPADIALLTPTSTDVPMYERALIQRGIAVSSAAGKLVLDQQEVHDMLILTRVLANEEDTMALGALLRGPLVGATEAQLLEAASEVTEKTGAWAMARSTNPEMVSNPVIKNALQHVQSVLLEVQESTPEQVLRRASTVFEVPTILRKRLGDLSFGRAIANLEWVFSYAADFATDGIQAFARAFTARWEAGESDSEPGNDASLGTVQIVTMHRSKGLEWPVVIPISTLKRPSSPRLPIHNTSTGAFAMRIGGADTSNFETVRDEELLNSEADRTRLWYVTFTRARNHFVLPTIAGELPTFQGIIDWDPLEATTVPDAKERPYIPRHHPENAGQSEDEFGLEQQYLHSITDVWRWKNASGGVDEVPTAAPYAGPGVDPTDTEVEQFELPVIPPAPPVSPASYTSLGAGAHRLGTVRGNVIHVLYQELITGIVEDTEDALAVRAAVLLTRIPAPEEDPEAIRNLDPVEMARTTLAGWNLPLVRRSHGRLFAEVPVYGARDYTAYSGVIDAVVFDSDGDIEAVIDWKTDVAPTAETRAMYEGQVRAYLELSGAPVGYIVYASLGLAETVAV